MEIIVKLDITEGNVFATNKQGIRVFALKLDGVAASTLKRAIEDVKSGFEPDCFIAGYGLADKFAIGPDSVFKTTKPLQSI